MTPTPTQLAVLRRMAESWELADSMAYTGLTRIQQGGAGYGGKTKTVSASTVGSLLQKGFIKIAAERWPTRTYKLTPAGRAAAEAGQTNGKGRMI